MAAGNEVLNAVDVVLPVSEELGVVDPHIEEIVEFELVKGAKAVGVDGAVRLDFTGACRDQRVGLGVFHRHDKDVAAAFQQPEHRDSACYPPTVLSLTHSAILDVSGIWDSSFLIASRTMANDLYAFTGHANQGVTVTGPCRSRNA